jgi:hypothetical protein
LAYKVSLLNGKLPEGLIQCLNKLRICFIHPILLLFVNIFTPQHALLYYG